MIKPHYIRFIVIYVFILSFGQLSSQVGFNSETIVESIWEGDMREIQTHDLNGDGNNDIVFITVFGNTNGFIGWFENEGDIEFNAYRTILDDVDFAIRSFQVGDLDGDGDLDIVFTSPTQLYWVNNLDGKGAFSDPILIHDDIQNPRLKLADVDNDNDLDIVAITFSGGEEEFWFENTSGLGDFSAHSFGVNIFLAYIIEVIDVDGDGDNDILYSGDQGWLSWIEDVDGEGNFDVKHEIKGFGADVFFSPTDLDDDGDFDILVSEGYRLVWFENLGEGNFDSKSVIMDLPGDDNDYYPPKFMDLNFDSKMDVVTLAKDEIFYHINLGGQLFETTVLPINRQHALPLITEIFAYEDLDNDGDYEFFQFLNSTSTPFLWVFDNQNNTSFEELDKLEYYDKKFTSIKLADIDGDSDLDFLTEDSDNNTISWFENDGVISSLWEERLISDSVWATNFIPPADPLVMDVDGDLDMDIVKNNLDESLFWLENIDGKGNYGAPIHFANIESEVNQLNSVDIDADGDLDVVVGFEDYILLYNNEDGLGTFSAAQEIHQGNRIVDIHAADLDGDGLSDIIHETQFDGTFWQKNVDGNNFSDTIRIEDYSIGGLVRDIDQDGDLDIIRSRIFGNELGWYENDGLGNFTTYAEEITNGGSLVVLLTIDVDKDGDEDLIVYSSGLFDFGWIENLGPSNGFSDYEYVLTNTEKNISIGRPGVSLDVDLDGDEDFFVIQGDQILLYENRFEGNFINGKVRFSNNINDCESSDYALKNILVEASSSFETLTTNTNESGNYTLSPLDGIYTTSIIPTDNGFDVNPEMFTNDFMGFGESVVNNFCITPNTAINDLSVDIYSARPPRPGFEVEYNVVFNNKGTTLMNGQIVFDFDETIISFLEANAPIETQQTNSLTFAFSDLSPLESRTIQLTFKVGLIPDVTLGDNLIVKASALPTLNDFDPADNVFEYTRKVVGSYDPNDIQVMEGPQILVSEVDNYLHYVIRFQNTGNFPAEKVRITNSLDAQLDYRKLVLGESSHPYTMMITDGEEIEFKFDNINLPDSINNEPESHGFITYKIKPFAGFDLGDIVYNDASIYFDFNPPVETNTVSTEVVDVLNSKDLSIPRVRIYPNPVDQKLRIHTEEQISSIEITDVFGTKTLVFGDLETLDFSEFGAGVYFVVIHFEAGGSIVEKVIKI